jgi:hypothetical protein
MSANCQHVPESLNDWGENGVIHKIGGSIIKKWPASLGALSNIVHLCFLFLERLKKWPPTKQKSKLG